MMVVDSHVEKRGHVMQYKVRHDSIRLKLGLHYRLRNEQFSGVNSDFDECIEVV